MAAKKKRTSTPYKVPALERAFAILDALNQTSFGLTVEEIRALLKIPYSSTFYLLETMRRCGYVQRDAQTKKYNVGYKLLAFRESQVVRQGIQLRALANPLLHELTALTTLTSHVAVLHQAEAVYVERVEPTGFIRINTWVGMRVALHCTAVGKALLLSMSEEQIRAILPADRLVRKTDRTHTSIESLLEDLSRSRTRGYTVDDAEDEKEGRCLATPVFGADGTVAASIGVSGTVWQIEPQRVDSLGKLILKFAADLSAKLGWQPATSGPPSNLIEVLRPQ
jgi:IclR family acetate operon transcriptional repressor